MGNLIRTVLGVVALSACASSVLPSGDVQASGGSAVTAEHRADSRDRLSYPAAWWAPVPREGVPAWEVLPQDAGPGEVILSKRTELGILSNFAATPLTLDGKTYASMEGFWQMMKYPEGPQDPRATFPGLTWPMGRDAVGQLTGFDAKRAGDAGTRNMTAMGINWVTWNGVQMPYRVQEKGDHYQLIRRAMQAKLEQNAEVRRILLATGDLILRPDHDQGEAPPPAWQYHKIWMELRAEIAARP